MLPYYYAPILLYSPYYYIPHIIKLPYYYTPLFLYSPYYYIPHIIILPFIICIRINLCFAHKEPPLIVKLYMSYIYNV